MPVARLSALSSGAEIQASLKNFGATCETDSFVEGR